MNRSLRSRGLPLSRAASPHRRCKSASPPRTPNVEILDTDTRRAFQFRFEKVPRLSDPPPELVLSLAHMNDLECHLGDVCINPDGIFDVNAHRFLVLSGATSKAFLSPSTRLFQTHWSKDIFSGSRYPGFTD